MFRFENGKTAQYLRVNNKSLSEVQKAFDHLLSKWKLERSGGWQLIISVTGGAQDFTLNHGLKKAFKEGLIKAACATDAWIITGGTNTGIMRLVGEAVNEEAPLHRKKNKLTVLGIAPLNKIKNRHQMFDVIH